MPDNIEIDFSRLGRRGEALEAMVRHLAEALSITCEWSGRGADEGKDLLFVESREGHLGRDTIRWLVQCKDHWTSGKSVSEEDVGSILDKVVQHRAQGYLLVTTTKPSSGLKKTLDALDAKNGGPIRTCVWDRDELAKLLGLDVAAKVRVQYFDQPQSVILPEVNNTLFYHEMLTQLYLVQKTLSELSFNLRAQQSSISDPNISLIDDINDFLNGMKDSIESIRPIDHVERGWCRVTAALFDVITREAGLFARLHGRRFPQLELPDRAALDAVSPLRVPARILHLVLRSLLSNSIKYSKMDEPPYVRVSIDESPDKVILHVEDKGIGVDPEDADRIFMEGYRGPAAQRLSMRGLGLGLNIARSAIREYGGDLLFEGGNLFTHFVLVFNKQSRDDSEQLAEI